MSHRSLPDYAAYKHLVIDVRDNGVAVITLNRPDVLNAMHRAMHQELVDVWLDLDADPAVKAVVVTGAGRAFSAGADLKEPPATSFADVNAVMERVLALAYRMTELPKPIISAINGPAVGAGLQLALLADISVAAADAKLIDGNLRVGAAASDHAMLIWPLLCGLAKAKYYLLTGATVTGAEAERVGLVSLAVPTEEVLPRALAIAETVAAAPAHLQAWTKRGLNAWLNLARPIYEQSIAHLGLSLLNPERQASLARK